MTTKTLTSDECIVSIDRLKLQNGFTKQDQVIHDKLCDPATEPRMFDNVTLEKVYGLTFKGRRLISFKEMDTNDTFGDSVRDGLNPEYDNINDSIQSEGFKLKQIAPCAYYKNNKWVILEGRTRISILKSLGVTGDLLINEYEKVDDSIPDAAFALHSNTVNDPKGVATQADMIRHLQNRITAGDFEFDETANQDDAKREFKKQIKDYVKEKFPKLRLSGPNLDSLLKNAMANKSVKHNIKSFSSLGHAMSHLNTVLGVIDTKKYKYVMAATDEWGIFKRIVPVWENMKAMNDKRIIRVVTCNLTLKSTTDWYLANVRVGKKMKSHIDSTVEIFGSATGNAPQVEIYGTIPQCESLEKKYPMNKVVVYDKVSNAEYNLYGEKV